MGLGSGLARRPSDPPGVVWAVGDRGPNIKPKVLVEMYGHEPAKALLGYEGAKVMPRTDVGPAIAQFRVTEDAVEMLALHSIADAKGTPVSGLPHPSSEHARCEPAFAMDGTPIDPDPSGLDSEGLIAFADGTFLIGDEFGPSLVRLDRRARVLARHAPHGVALGEADGAPLPAIAAKRQLNRGFEAMAASPDERWLYLAFQSPLAHPDEDAHEAARHTRLWRLDARTLAVTGQFLYPFDEPASFLRDRAKGSVERSDLKVSELVCLAPDVLIVLERCSETTKLYRVELTDAAELPAEHLDPATRPTAEQISADGDPPALSKRLIFSTDDAPQVAADLEGMVPLSDSALLLVNDNDFGVEGKSGEFWRIEWDRPVLAP